MEYTLHTAFLRLLECSMYNRRMGEKLVYYYSLPSLFSSEEAEGRQQHQKLMAVKVVLA